MLLWTKPPQPPLPNLSSYLWWVGGETPRGKSDIPEIEQWKNPYLDLNIIRHVFALRLSLVAFQLWRVLEQLAPEFMLNHFFLWSSWPEKCKTVKKYAKNALTSHYANGHGDPSDKWVKKHVDASTDHQVNFLKGLGFFHNCQHVWGLWKNPKIQSHLAKFGCGSVKVLV